MCCLTLQRHFFISILNCQPKQSNKNQSLRKEVNSKLMEATRSFVVKSFRERISAGIINRALQCIET